MAAIECKTIVNKNALSILIKYYHKNDKIVRKRKIFIYFVCTVLLICTSYLLIDFGKEHFNIENPITMFLVFGMIIAIYGIWYAAVGMEKTGTPYCNKTTI